MQQNVCGYKRIRIRTDGALLVYRQQNMNPAGQVRECTRIILANVITKILFKNDITHSTRKNFIR